jgi:hypothetical protein
MCLRGAELALAQAVSKVLKDLDQVNFWPAPNQVFYIKIKIVWRKHSPMNMLVSKRPGSKVFWCSHGNIIIISIWWINWRRALFS